MHVGIPIMVIDVLYDWYSNNYHMPLNGMALSPSRWGRPLLHKILSHGDPVGAKSLIISRYSLVAPQQHLAKKVQYYNRKSTTRFPMSLR